MVRIGAYAEREPEFLGAVYIAIQTNFARVAFRAASAISQYKASIQPHLLWTYFL